MSQSFFFLLNLVADKFVYFKAYKLADTRVTCNQFIVSYNFIKFK